MDSIYSIYFICLALVVVLLLIRAIISTSAQSQIKGLKNNSLEVTPEEFFRIRNTKQALNNRKNVSTSKDFEGIYIIFNHSKNMYYVGQSKRVIQRVNSHFTGKGNGDVYADYKYGDHFTISMIALAKSGFSTLNELERNAIKTYSAYSNGYNKTRGNRG